MQKKTINKNSLSYTLAENDWQKWGLAGLAIRYKLFIDGWSLRSYLEEIRISDNHLDYEISMCFYDEKPIAVCVLERDSGMIMFFTRKLYRQNGVAKRLCEITRERYNGDIFGSQYCREEGIGFFNKIGLEIR